MNVFVEIFMGDRFDIKVQPTDTVLNVKKQIEEHQGAQIHPSEQQLLIYQGKELKDETTIKENKVKENALLVVKLSKTVRHNKKTYEVQNPDTKEFSSSHIHWVKVVGRLGVADHVAVIPYYRAKNFVDGEGFSAKTKFMVSARNSNTEDKKAEDSSRKKRVDAILENTSYYCRYGPGRKCTKASKKKCEGRPRTRRGCLARFTVTRPRASPFVAIIKYNQRKHVDKSGFPCHKTLDDKAIGTRFMTRSSNHGGTDPPLTLGPSNHRGTDPKLTREPSTHRGTDPKLMLGLSTHRTWLVKKKRTIQGKVSTAEGDNKAIGHKIASDSPTIRAT